MNGLGVVVCAALLLPGCRGPEPPKDSVLDVEFSPDGQGIVFSYRKGKTVSIYRAKPDGSNVERLTGPGTVDQYPSYSPDGTQIVFSSSRDGDPGDVYVMNADGSGVRRLTKGPQVDSEPQFASDGKRIFFQRPRRYESYSPIAPKCWHGWDIFSINADGSAETAITNGSYYGMGRLAIAPDGRHLIVSIIGDPDYTCSIDLTAPRDPTVDDALGFRTSKELSKRMSGKYLMPCSFRDFSFSRDGQSVVFVGSAKCMVGSDVYVMDWSRQEVVTKLTCLDSFVCAPRFSSDGTKVIFLMAHGYRQEKRYELWETVADGTADQRRIHLKMPEPGP